MKSKTDFRQLALSSKTRKVSLKIKALYKNLLVRPRQCSISVMPISSYDNSSASAIPDD
jgi:hypothetical protein